MSIMARSCAARVTGHSRHLYWPACIILTCGRRRPQSSWEFGRDPYSGRSWNTGPQILDRVPNSPSTNGPDGEAEVASHQRGSARRTQTSRGAHDTVRRFAHDGVSGRVGVPSSIGAEHRCAQRRRPVVFDCRGDIPRSGKLYPRSGECRISSENSVQHPTGSDAGAVETIERRRL